MDAVVPTRWYRPDPFLAEFLHQTPVQPKEEIRALWVVRDALRAPETIDRLVDFVVRTRFHLLFVQVRGRGDAYYNSRIEPPATDLDMPIEEFDPLEYLLIKTRRVGISVHAWVNVYYVWSDFEEDPPEGHVVRRRPEWLMPDEKGRRMDDHPVEVWQSRGIEGYYLSPAHPEVRRYTAGVVEDIVSRYPVDGVHLDYVRYPGAGYGFGVGDRTDLALRWGVDPLDVVNRRGHLSGLIGRNALAMMDSVLVSWRAQQVDSALVAIREVMGELPLSAAVFADPEIARREKGQDWIRWVHTGLVDFVVPMAYSYSPQELERRVHILYNMIGRDRMLVGLALHNGRDRHLGESIGLMRNSNAAGYSLFSYNVLADRQFAVQFLDQVFFAGDEGGE